MEGLLTDLQIKTSSKVLSDIPLILSLVSKLGIVQAIDLHIKAHKNHEGLSTGWLVGIWLTHILHTGSHAKSTVRDWSNQHKGLLEQLTGEKIREVDFEDNRLGRVLRRLSKPSEWLAIEKAIWSSVVDIYELGSIKEMEAAGSAKPVPLDFRGWPMQDKDFEAGQGWDFAPTRMEWAMGSPSVEVGERASRDEPVGLCLDFDIVDDNGNSYLLEDLNWEGQDFDMGQQSSSSCVWLPPMVVPLLEVGTPVAGVHIDFSASSGYHSDGSGLMQYGKSKDHRPDLRQIKLLGASFEGVLLTTQALPGNEADNPHYLPTVQRVGQIVKKDGLLFCGDSKMADLNTRAHLVHSKDYYLTRLPATNGNVDFINDCISKGKEEDLGLIYGKDRLLGGGYELTRPQSATIELAQGKQQKVEWTERVVVVRSLNYAQAEEKRLVRNIDKAMAKIEKLTPEPGRGKRQIRSEEQLQKRISTICQHYTIDPALLEVVGEKQVTIIEKYARRGRAKEGEQRAKKQIEQVRMQVKEVHLNPAAFQEAVAQLGWIVYVTQVPKTVMNMTQTVSTYRQNNSLENQFRRFKNDPINIRPIWVRKDDQIEGLTHLLSIALRLTQYAETIMKQYLEQQPDEEDKTIAGLYPELPTKKTATPTFKRCCTLFSKSKITRVDIQINGNHVKSELHRFQPIHWKILTMLNIPMTVYTELRI